MLDDDSMIPSAEEAVAAATAWKGRVASTNPDEKADGIRALLDAKRSKRRSLQYTNHQDWKYELAHVRGVPVTGLSDATSAVSRGTCNDNLAVNFGVNEYCRYDCEVLKQIFFPADASTLCFAYATPETASSAWPLELMGMRQDWLDWLTLLQPTDAAAAAATFQVGDGPACINVTIQVSDHIVLLLVCVCEKKLLSSWW